jgi:hypothetical protein
VRTEREPVLGDVVHLVLVLLVACDRDVVASFRTAGERVKVLLRTCERGDAPYAITEWSPFVVVTMRDERLEPLYASLARVAGASLVITDGGVSTDEAEGVLSSAVFDGWLARQAQGVT